MKSHRLVFIDKDLERVFNELSDKDPIKKGLIRAMRDIRENFGVGRFVAIWIRKNKVK